MTTLSQFQKALYFALFTFVLCSGLAAAAQWSSTQLSLDYSNDDNVQPPAVGTPTRTVWELIAATEKNDQTAFCSALHEASEEKCAEIFDVWRKRIGTEYPIRLVALGSRQEHEACVSVVSWTDHPEPDAATFADVLYLVDHGNGNWKVHVQKPDQATTAFMALMHEQTADNLAAEIHADWMRRADEEVERNFLAPVKELFDKELRKTTTDEEYAIHMRCRALRETMKKDGTSIPKNFAQMLDLYDATLYTPPLVFEADKDMELTDPTDWKQVVMHAFRVRGPIFPPHGWTHFQVLAYIDREVDGRGLRFVYGLAVDSSASAEERWMVADTNCFVRNEDNTWTDEGTWFQYPGIYSNFRHPHKDAQAFQSFHGSSTPSCVQGVEALETAFEDADLPAPFDRFYPISECEPFAPQD